MLHPETLEAYRKMTTSERLKLTQELIRQNTPYLLYGTPDQVKRKFELLRLQNDDRNRRMAEVFANAKANG